MTMNLETRCPMCGTTSVVVVNEDDFFAWQNGELIQNAFPYLDADERERLISGICPDCWERMFNDPDYDEDWEEPAWHDECDEEEEEEWEEREDFPDDHLWDSYDLDFGFNPYMGCYDYDC